MNIVVHEIRLFLNIDNCIENSNYVDKSILLMLVYDYRINRFVLTLPGLRQTTAANWHLFETGTISGWLYK